jgi:hypothetical protein
MPPSTDTSWRAPDLVIEIRQDILEVVNGPMLKYGLPGFKDQRIQVPRSARSQPNRELLAERHELFTNASSAGGIDHGLVDALTRTARSSS